jgi:hypothetical protein
VPAFSFVEALSVKNRCMPQNKKHKNIIQRALEQFEAFLARPLAISSRGSFVAFIAVSFAMTTLLYGATLRVALEPSPVLAIVNPHAALERRIDKVVVGYPIEQMSRSISRYDQTTAAFLVGIAKKESNWGKRVPVDDEGKDCYNYWGYRGAGSRGIAMGHGCFGSPEEAVGVVGGRIDTFVKKYEFDTPEELIVWKCGWNCSAHTSQSVKKWIADVGIYYRKVKN